jgi:hypothetical protein
MHWGQLESCRRRLLLFLLPKTMAHLLILGRRFWFLKSAPRYDDRRAEKTQDSPTMETIVVYPVRQDEPGGERYQAIPKTA